MVMEQFVFPLVSFTIAVAVFIVTPGLDTVMTLRTAASEGRLAGAGAVLGICVGLCIWGIAAAFGLAVLFQASGIAFMIVKCAGAAYLAWLGMGFLVNPRSGFPGMGKEECKEVQQPHVIFWSACQRGLITNILNPKVGIFTLTFFPQFIPSHVNTVLFSLILTAIQTFLDILWLGALVFLTAPLGRFLQRPKVVQCLDCVTGVVFIGFGVKILLQPGPV